MKVQNYSCEKQCSQNPLKQPTQFVVITGGPGAGKTAVLEIMRKILCEHVTILPESATILFGGGFWRLNSDSARKASQRAIYHIQTELQTLSLEENRWTIGLCDRGTLDGLAYWPDDDSKYFEQLHTSIEIEYAKYVAVIHLSTPTLEGGYNHQNPIRTESADEAAAIDQKIHNVWKNHPHYTRIESTQNFITKVYRTYMTIQKFLPQCCKHQLTMETL